MSFDLTLPRELVSYIDKWKNKRGSLIMILHAVQESFGYIPKDICFILSKKLDIPLARIYEVLTFYNYFKLKKNAKYKISVCLGTACYLKGAKDILKTIKETLQIKEKEMTPDGLFELDIVRCLGCCAMAPVVSINGKVYGKLTGDSILEILEKCKKEDCSI